MTASHRLVLNEQSWRAIEPHLCGRPQDPGRSGHDNRRFIEAIAWIARTGSPWRDLPEFFGRWATVYRRYRRWAKSGVWERIWCALAPLRDAPRGGQQHVCSIDSTAMRVHQHGAPRRDNRRAQAVGKSRAGWTTKLHAAVDPGGQLRALVFSPGQDADVSHAPALLEQLGRGRTIVADKAYDKDALVQQIEDGGGRAVIPPRRSRRQSRMLDRETYRLRYVVEQHFAHIKQFRRIASRFERTLSSWAGMVLFVEALRVLR